MKSRFILTILILLWVLNLYLFKAFAYNGIDVDLTWINIQSKDYEIWSTNYSFYYWDNGNEIWLTNLDNVIKEVKYLNEILSKTNIYINSYVLSGNELKNYKFSQIKKEIVVNWYTFSYFLNKYYPEKSWLLNNTPFTIDDSNIVITWIVKWLFNSFNDIPNNQTPINNLIDNLSSKLFLIKDNNVTDNETSESFLNNIYNVFSLEFSNKVNSQLKYYYQSKENLFGSKKEYLVLDYNDISWSYTWKLDLINNNYNILVSIINQNYWVLEQNNIDTNIIWFSQDINNVIIEAKNYSQTDYPNIFISSVKTNLFNDLNNIRNEIIGDLDAYRDYLILKKIEEENSQNTWTLNYIDWIYNSSWTIDFEYFSSWSTYNPNLVWTGVNDYNISTWNWALYNLEDFSSGDSKDIINLINNYINNQWEKYDSREDYWLAIAKNIDRYTNLLSFLSWSTTLNDELFTDSVNVNSLLSQDIKNEFLNINDTHTVRDVNLQSFSSGFINDNNSLILLRNEIINYWKLLMNNQFISSDIVLPSTSKVNNEVLYKSYLNWEKWTYFNNYNKSVYTQIQARNDVEWLTFVKFGYIPSPQQIKDNSNNQLWIRLGNNFHYYLNDTNKWIEINLDDWFDYTLKIKSYNWKTSWITLNLIDWDDNIIPIVLRWNIISKSNGKIKSKIIDTKNENDSINSLYVNDILYK